MRLNEYKCRACDEQGLALIRNSSISTSDLESSDFAISDSDYGITTAIYRCPACGLLQCPDSTSVLEFYEKLQDPQYEEGREERNLQAEKLVKELLKTLGCENGVGLKLLDVGAGSGILLEAAQKFGFEAVGIEPSTWLANIAKERKLNIHAGVLPHPAINDEFDVVMLIDVIEHVTEPLMLLRQARNYVKPGGIVLVVTPDVSSFFARVLGFKWWHYRIAHISYFNKKTLRLVTERAGLKFIKFSRPGWYFSYAYLRERLLKYLPSWLVPPAIGPLKHAVIPLNLYDSLLIVCERQ